jgi:uncharacterized protein (DUF2461 family)
MNEGTTRISSVSSPLTRTSSVRLEVDDHYVQATSNRFVMPIYVPMETMKEGEKTTRLAMLTRVTPLLDWVRKVHDGCTVHRS